MRVATFGTGFFSAYHYDAWNRIPGVDVVGLCVNSNRARGEEFASRYGVAKVFEDPAQMLDETKPDLVDIITTPESHLALALAACARKIPIICQKPLAPSFADAETLVKETQRTGTLLVAHDNWRFRPWYRELSNLLKQNVIGDLYSISFRMRPGDGQGPSAYLDRQPYFQKMPRFLMHETGIHMIDVFRYLLGEITGVFARLRRLNPVIAGEDSGLVTFSFESGVLGTLDGNRLADFDAENTRLTMGETCVEGSRGAIRIDGRARIFIRNRGKAEREHEYDWPRRGYAGDSVYALQAHVVDHLRQGTPLENTGGEYLNAVRVEEAAYQSHQEECWIKIQHPRRAA